MVTPHAKRTRKKRNDSYRNPIDAARIDELRRSIPGCPVAILTHDNPDPDALASGKGLAVLFEQLWDIPCTLIFRGIIARAENKAMLRLLTPEWIPIPSEMDWHSFSAIVMVDTQPGAGNNPLPDSLHPHVVIDHHRQGAVGVHAPMYQDVRYDVGSTSSMVYQYLEAA